MMAILVSGTSARKSVEVRVLFQAKLLKPFTIKVYDCKKGQSMKGFLFPNLEKSHKSYTFLIFGRI